MAPWSVLSQPPPPLHGILRVPLTPKHPNGGKSHSVSHEHMLRGGAWCLRCPGPVMLVKRNLTTHL